jgi:hypothetical protein
MAVTPSRLGRRYLPFLAVAAVQVLLVAVAPSRGPLAGSGQQAASNGSASAGNPGAQDAAAGGAAGAAGTGGALATATQGAGGGPSTAGASPAGGGGPGGPGFSGVKDLSKCDPKTGKEIGPLTDSAATNWIMPNCLPVFHGTNGGATMTGVTATAINYVTFQIHGDPTFNATAGAAGLQSTPEQWCEGQQAFRDEIQKRWELFGRKLVSLDGPGANAGSGQQSPCHFPYFQSQCNPAPADEACFRAEARVIASMHPAMVLATTLDPALFDELTNRQHIIAFTTATTPFPAANYQKAAPYFYSAFMDGTRLATFDAEYWCKKLNNKPAIHAGADVTTTRNWGPAPGVPPTRKVGVIFPEDPGNTINKQNVDVFTKLVSGGPGSMCSSPGGVFQFPVASDPSQLATQTNTAMNAMIQNHITDVVLWTDPLVGPTTFTNTAQANNYSPEYYVVGQGLMDDNQIAQLYNPAQWAHALGVSPLWTMVPFAQSDATKAWQDVGNSGMPGVDQALYIYPYLFMGNAFMEAGASPTPALIHQGLLSMGTNGGWAKLHDPKLAEWGLDQSSPWTFEEDMREVYWSTNRTAEDNGKAGSYCPVGGGRRYNPGEFPTGDPSFAEPGC